MLQGEIEALNQSEESLRDLASWSRQAAVGAPAVSAGQQAIGPLKILNGSLAC